MWQKDEGQFDQDLYLFGGCGGAVAYRREMLEEIGLFDEDLYMYLEDVDLNWRAQLAGYRAVFAPQAVVYHHLSATGGGIATPSWANHSTKSQPSRQRSQPQPRRPAMTRPRFMPQRWARSPPVTVPSSKPCR